MGLNTSLVLKAPISQQMSNSASKRRPPYDKTVEDRGTGRQIRLIGKDRKIEAHHIVCYGRQPLSALHS
eukprot:scaffold2848_cov352-Pavlova_lutheri.AAC.51